MTIEYKNLHSLSYAVYPPREDRMLISFNITFIYFKTVYCKYGYEFFDITQNTFAEKKSYNAFRNGYTLQGNNSLIFKTSITILFRFSAAALIKFSMF